MRKIIHIDMDAFYASVEQLDHPELRGKALAVGGSKERGVVAAASYEARRFGVRSAMPSIQAARLCPSLIFVPPRFERYKEVSLAIRDLFFEYTDLVEPLSLDEAYLDVSENKKQQPSATLLAKEIRERIKSQTGLNASAGISYNKFLAKIASDLNKPNGQATIKPEDATEFLEKLAIEKFHGIGKVTATKLRKLGVQTGLELKSLSLAFLTDRFGKSGLYYYQIVRGIHQSPVQPNRIRKSISAERTFDQNLIQEEALSEALRKVVEELQLRLKRSGIQGRTLTLKIKYEDFSIQTRSQSQEQYLNPDHLLAMSLSLLFTEPLSKAIRLLGVGISNLNTREDKVYGIQLKLNFPPGS